MSEEYASKRDLERVETKVDDLSSGMVAMNLAVQGIKHALEARDRLENQAQILKAEVSAAEARLAAERTANEKSWNDLKTRALWIAMSLLTAASYPQLVSAFRTLKGLLP